MAVRHRPKPKPGTDDLDILNPDRTVLVLGELWTVREYSFLEAAQVSEAGERAVRAFDHPDGKLDVLEFIALLALATGKGGTQIAALPDLDFEALSKVWRDVNARVFEPVTAPRQHHKPPRWGDVYTLLIAHGHTAAGISKYTQRQVTLYYECAMRLDARRRADRIVDVNLGTNGNKEAKAAIRQLTQE